MSNDENLMEAAVRSKAFLDGVTALAHEQKLTRGLALSLLGLFAKYLIDCDVADGDDRETATVRAIDAFMRGAGAQLQQLTPEQAQAALGSNGETVQ